ncbi:MAG: hypothetical protein WC510_06260 [Candidatus Omnitrophota bacterium]
MPEELIIETLRKILFVIGIIGALVGADIIFGAKLLVLLKRILDKGNDIVDKMALSKTGHFFLGLIILVISVVILTVLIKT